MAITGNGKTYDKAAHYMFRSILTDGELLKNKGHYYDLARGKDSPFV